MQLSPFQRSLRSLIKRVLYAQVTLREALLVLRGRSKPLIEFRVEADPPSVYYNFAVPPERLAPLADYLQLPEGFELTPIACVDGEQPFVCLTLNLYRVSGIAAGTRAEWSVYVRTPQDPVPRYMIVEAVCDGASMDPIEIVSWAGQVSHASQAGRVQSMVVSAQGGELRASLQRPVDGPPARAARQWVEANDVIYWRNGVGDRVFYAGSLANARMTAVDPAQCELSDTTPWGAFVDPVPRHVLVFEDVIDFIISPWWTI